MTSREAFAEALAEMQAAHDALTADRSDANFAAYAAACAKARKAFEQMVQAGFDRARKGDAADAWGLR
jgi:hypothetical protein